MPDHHTYTAQCPANVDAWFLRRRRYRSSPRQRLRRCQCPVRHARSVSVRPWFQTASMRACVTDASVGDLMVPWCAPHSAVRVFRLQHPARCGLATTVPRRFTASSSAPHAFHMEVGNSLGARVPLSIRDETRSRNPNFGGLGRRHFHAGFDSFIVVVPTSVIKMGSTDGFPNQDRTRWKIGSTCDVGFPRQLVTDQSVRPKIAPEAAPPTGTVTASGARPKPSTELAKAPRKLDRLFGVCDCEESGCFPTKSTTRWRRCRTRGLSGAPRDSADRSGHDSVLLLLPPGVVPITINQSAAAYDRPSRKTARSSFGAGSAWRAPPRVRCLRRVPVKFRRR